MPSREPATTNRPLSTFAALAFLIAPSLLAQDVLHYEFDEHCGAEGINFGHGAGNASIVTNLAGGVAAARVAGRFDQALPSASTGGGSTWLDTGRAPTSPGGSFSFGMWLRNKPGNPTAIGFG